MQAPIKISALSAADIEEAFRLALAEGWNQTRDDWLRLLKHQPKGCFGAYCGERLVGTVTTSLYGNQLGWLGMMLVEREYRGRGIGGQLIAAALAYARGEGISTIKLDATPVGQPLYESFGFIPESASQRWERAGEASQPTGSNLVEQPDSRMHEVDRIAFGADRTAMLGMLTQQSCTRPILSADSAGKVRGYALARPGSRAIYIGPIIALDSWLIPELVDDMSARFPGKAVYVDVHMSSQVKCDLLSTRGFVKQRDLTRMRYGKPNSAGLSPSIFAIAGPEIG